MQSNALLPCCAFAMQASNSKPSREEIEIRIKNGESLFTWSGNSSLEDKETPTHFDLLEELDIPHIVDIHTHFFPEVVMKLIWRWFDSVDWEIQYRFAEEKRVEFLGLNKIKYFTTLNYAHKANMAESLNDWTFQNYRNWKGAIPFGTFYPEGNVLSYVKKALEIYGFKGFKLHCEVSKLDLSRDELANTFAYLEELQIPIIIHTGNAPLPGEFTGIHYFSKFMKNFPKLNVIVAHMGAYEISEYASLLDIYPNLKLDTTMVFVDFLATGNDTENYFPLLDTYSDRIFFGSDFPNIPYPLSHPITKLLSASIKPDSKRKILYENGMKLFKLSQ